LIEKLRWLQQAWREGMDSGDAGQLDFAALKAEARRRLAADARARGKDSLHQIRLIHSRKAALVMPANAGIQRPRPE
jgi:hypothetical protein